MEVDQGVARLDELVEDVPRKRIGERPVARPREATVEVLSVLWDDEGRPRAEGRHADDGHGRDPAREPARVERVHEADDSCDRRVLTAVDPTEQAEVRAVARPGRLEARKLDPGEQLVVEADRAALDHPASRASTSTSGSC